MGWQITMGLGGLSAVLMAAAVAVWYRGQYLLAREQRDQADRWKADWKAEADAQRERAERAEAETAAERKRCDDRLSVLEQEGRDSDVLIDQLVSLLQERDPVAAAAWVRDRVRRVLGPVPEPVDDAPTGKLSAPKPVGETRDQGQ